MNFGGENVPLEKIERPDYLSYDFYSSDYNESLGQINVYYRRIIEDQQLKHEMELEALRKTVESLSKNNQLLQGDLSTERSRSVGMNGKIEELSTLVVTLRSQLKSPAASESATYLLQEKTKEIVILRNDNESLRAQLASRLPPRVDEEARLLRELGIKERLLRETQERVETLEAELRDKDTELSVSKRHTQNILLELDGLRREFERLRVELAVKETSNVCARTELTIPPQLVEENKRLAREVDMLSAELVKLKKNAFAAEEELNKASSALEKAEFDRAGLRNKLERTEFEKQSEGQDLKTNYLSKIHRLIDRQDHFASLANKAFFFRLLEARLEARKARNRTDGKVLVTQKLEVIDGTLQIFVDLRQKMFDWVFHIFKNSSDQAFKKKKSSFTLFENVMLDLRSKQALSGVVAAVFFRLKTLVSEELPRFRTAHLSKENKDFKAEVLPDLLVDIEGVPEGSVTSQGQQWFLSTLGQILQRKKTERKDNKMMLYLFRLLALIYRAECPIVCDRPVQLTPEVKEIITTKIVSATVKVLVQDFAETKKVFLGQTGQILDSTKKRKSKTIDPKHRSAPLK